MYNCTSTVVHVCQDERYTVDAYELYVHKLSTGSFQHMHPILTDVSHSTQLNTYSIRRIIHIADNFGEH